jgi:hypothetical protein
MQTFKTKVRMTKIPQQDSVTCQSACIASALGMSAKDVSAVRRALVEGGVAGDPTNMGNYIQDKIGSARYDYTPVSSINQAAELIGKDGALLIVHGWFTNSGHVIILDGVNISNQVESFSVYDPWSEFDGETFSYPFNARFYDGNYSSRLIYATCVEGQSRNDARALYRAGKLDPDTKNMYTHIIYPDGKQ